MNTKDLLYNEIAVNDIKTSQMLDLLLAKLFEPGQYRYLRTKGSPIVTFKFWSTKEEYDGIIEAMEREMNHWDDDYEELLSLYEEGVQ